MPTTAKPILFCDFDGTICHDRYWRNVSPAVNAHIQALLFGNDRTMTHEWMRGVYTAEDINRYLAEKIAIPFDELWTIFVQDCQTMYVEPAVLAQLASLKNTFQTVLITGNMDSFSRFTAPALKLSSYFDYISNSYYEKKHKTDNDGELFMEYCKKLGTEIGSAILIDDSPYVCDIFKKLGGTAHLITVDKDIHYYLKRLAV